MPAATPEELAACREECLRLGFGGFVVRRSRAMLQPQSREEVLEQKKRPLKLLSSAVPVLHVAPAPTWEAPDGGVQVEFDGTSYCAEPSTLSAKCGYFESAFRHDWADGGGNGCPAHRFAEFPGGHHAFALSLSWLSARPGASVGDPWPVQTVSDVQSILDAASYLDAPLLLSAAVRSWRLGAPRAREELLEVAGALAAASAQFDGDAQDRVLSELRQLLLGLPRHHLRLSPEFLVAPMAGLTVLEVRPDMHETLVGHIKTNVGNIGNWLSSVTGGASASAEEPLEPGACLLAEAEDCSTSHAFAVRLFDAHEAFFLLRLPALRLLLRFVEPTTAVVPPLCFRLAAAAAAAASVCEDEVFAGTRLAVDIFERGIASAPDPAQAASHEACTRGLFGAGGARGTGEAGAAPLGLDTLARPLVPPAAAAVVLSRVLSSWGACESREGSADAADVILTGVVSDRQSLRTMLERVLQQIATESHGSERGSEWGTCFDYAVPELRAALVRAVAGAEPNTQEVSETARLLFRVLFQPSGGLPDVRFPLCLLREVRTHNAACLTLAARRALSDLAAMVEQSPGSVWSLARQIWPVLAWHSVEVELIEDVVRTLREWLTDAKVNLLHGSEWAEAEDAAVQLLRQLPLQLLREPEELLGPPVPAHVLACLAYREQQTIASRIASLEHENAVLRSELMRISHDRPAGGGGGGRDG